MGTQRSTNLPKPVVLNPLHSGLAHCMGRKGRVKSGLDPPAGSRHLFCRTDYANVLATERLAAAALKVPAFNCQPSTGRGVGESSCLALATDE